MSKPIRAHLTVGIAQGTKFFPDFVLRSLPQGGYVLAGTELKALWKTGVNQLRMGAFQKETIRVCSGPINS